ncbi:hypothetical protein [Brumimicrobium aurantiacum]|uniref:Lipoprotein n=1 Tax=Brumimicrobium aurantiacum TaxID=1737063 RepID=A0A3E1EZZ0_9FLAO|nr:hypothetical protein [Brumimicrobium aurantiacum]RFC55139.1 hypothetical protein DXU93_04780 [Brumimicrobium aurantiacum]
MKIPIKFTLLLILIGFVFSCTTKTEVTRAFYAWQSHQDVDAIKNQKLFQKFKGERLYIKLFEVSYDQDKGAIPLSKMKMTLNEKYISEAEIVPCIFIENEVLSKLNTLLLSELADNMISLINKYFKEYLFETDAKIHDFNEIQLDCDWSKGNQDKYFQLIHIIKEKSKKNISCTMRLYPYKYRNEMGTPPVDRIMLLCYNLLNPTKNTDKNTILEIEELKKYIDFDTPYPTPVDVALPAYSSGYRFNQQRFSGVFHAVPQKLESITVPAKQHLHHIVKKDTLIQDLFFKKGEKIKIERVSATQLTKAAKLLANHLDQDKMNVAIYHLDHQELNRYNHEILDSLFTLFE